MINAQTLSAIWVRDPVLVNVFVWLTAAVLILCYLTFRREIEGDGRFQDMAFFSAVTLIVVYHRFYDEQLLLMVIPFLLTFNGKRKAGIVALWLLLLALLLPLHVIAYRLSSLVNLTTPLGLLLLRPLPLIVLAMCLLLIPWNAKPAWAKQVNGKH
jgi:hypothetical protein